MTLVNPVANCAPQGIRLICLALPGSLGELKWDGASGCYMVIDRKQYMLFVLLEQTPSERQRVQRTLKQLVYEAMEN